MLICFVTVFFSWTKLSVDVMFFLCYIVYTYSLLCFIIVLSSFTGKINSCVSQRDVNVATAPVFKALHSTTNVSSDEVIATVANDV